MLKSVGYDDAAAERRQIGGEFVAIVTVAANDALGVFPAERLILAVDPDAGQLG